MVQVTKVMKLILIMQVILKKIKMCAGISSLFLKCVGKKQNFLFEIEIVKDLVAPQMVI